MKFAILLSTLSLCAWANQKTYEFVWHRDFRGQNQVLRYKIESGAPEKALEAAALFCFDHFDKITNLSQDEKIDLIDVCVNPKTEKRN